MKSISITCLLCGTFIFAAPLLHQFGSFALCAYALANTHLSPMNISAPPLEDGYRLASVCFGLSLAMVGIVLAFLGQRVVLPGNSRQHSADPQAPSEA